MNGFVHRVKRGPKPTMFKLPVPRWKGRTYVTAEGIELVVQYSGKMESALWPEGTRRGEDIPARIHLPRVR